MTAYDVSGRYHEDYINKMKSRIKHVCAPRRSCCCSVQALEPDEDCPIHGYPYPPRCDCGRFIKKNNNESLHHL